MQTLIRALGRMIHGTTWLYTTWWKWLCATLLLYVVIGSFMVPLSPGISKIEPLSFSPDSIYTFQVSTYHSHFKSATAGKIQFWFKAGNDYLKAKSIEVIGEDKLEVKFGLGSLQQDSLKSTSFDVVCNDDIDGTFALREGTTLLKAAKADSTSNILAISETPQVTHNKHQFLAFPYREILYETIRNTFFHVPMWFAMTMLVMFSLVASMLFLIKGDFRFDTYAHQAIIVALLFGCCGYTTGMVWSKYTWFIGLSWWKAIEIMVFQETKLRGALISIIAYLIYLVLRWLLSLSVIGIQKRDRAIISAAYNIFAIIIFMWYIFIMPRLHDSLHPGNGGNPAFSKYDLDSTLRMFFYPACIGWIMLGFWIYSILVRMQLIKQKQES